MRDPVSTMAGGTAEYGRITSLAGVLNRWYLEAGIPAPDAVQRGAWRDEARARIDLGPIGDQALAMCNRYQPGDRKRIEDHFSAKVLREYNSGPDTVHPREPGWVVRGAGDGLLLEQMTWGFPVVLRGKHGQPLKPKPVNNARFDKLGTFWRRWATDPAHRCLIPAARFAEAVGEPGRMTETWLSLRDEPLFAWAGLWRDSDEWGRVYTGVMTDAAPELMDIHDRCPVILNRDDWQAWLTAPLVDLYRFDRPVSAQQLSVDGTNLPWWRRNRDG